MGPVKTAGIGAPGVNMMFSILSFVFRQMTMMMMIMMLMMMIMMMMMMMRMMIMIRRRRSRRRRILRSGIPKPWLIWKI